VAGNLMIGGATNQAVALAVFAYCLLAVRFARTLNQHFTEAWQARFEIADLAQRLKVQKEAAEEANLAKSRFLAAASHDLRQPVHALALFIGSLRHRSLDAQARELVEHADQAVKSMEALFGALLDMARLDAGVVRAELRPVALQPLLLKLVGEQRALAETKGLTLRCRPTALWVMSDPLKLERILRNLLVNALRYTDRGGVLLGCRRRAGQVQVQIWDTGCGIPVERQGELFQEFVQLQPDRHQRQGLGLGLAIVKRLAGLLSHRVLLQSRPERGSMFGIALLPCAAPAVIPEGVLPLAPALSVGAGGARQVLVLVLDDDAAIRTGLRLCLEDCGFDVLAAADLAEMRGLVHQLAACPALIIADHGLGAGLSGVDAIEALRDEFNADIPALVITGNTAPELLREVSAAGLALLHKPVSTELLLATVDALVAAPAVPAAHAVSRLSDP